MLAQTKRADAGRRPVGNWVRGLVSEGTKGGDMTTQETVAAWAACTNSSVWAAHGGVIGYSLAAVWLVFAVGILIVAYSKTPNEKLTGGP